MSSLPFSNRITDVLRHICPVHPPDQSNPTKKGKSKEYATNTNYFNTAYVLVYIYNIPAHALNTTATLQMMLLHSPSTPAMMQCQVHQLHMKTCVHRISVVASCKPQHTSSRAHTAHCTTQYVQPDRAQPLLALGTEKQGATVRTTGLKADRAPVSTSYSSPTAT